MRTGECLAVAGLLVLAGCAGTGPAAPAECVRIVAEDGTTGERCLPVAPQERRVDLGTPAFGRPTEVTNPLHPTGSVRQAIYGGQVDGRPFRTEVTLLADRKTIIWRGRRVEVLTSQYLALSNGRIHEVALDWYAQADDGSVWYLGEDVFNYVDGAVADTNGTWLAGPKAPAAMIMPARPAAGDVYRPENVPGVVFEEVSVSDVDQTVQGPSGPVSGAIVVEELHMDGTREKKTFAPGYGEFSTGNENSDLEAVSLALPTDATPGPTPSTLDTLAAAIRATADAVAAADWPTAATAVTSVADAWAAARPADVPLPVLNRQMDRDIATLAKAVATHDTNTARDAALRVAQNELDARSRHEPVDEARFALWARQLVIDATAGDTPAATGDRECLKWTFDRIRHTVPDPATVERTLSTLEDALRRGDLSGAAAQARTLAT